MSINREIWRNRSRSNNILFRLPIILLFGLAFAAAVAGQETFVLDRGPERVLSIPLEPAVFAESWKGVYRRGLSRVSVFYLESLFLAPPERPFVDSSIRLKKGSAPWSVYGFPAPERGYFFVFFSDDSLPWKDFIPPFLAGFRFFREQAQFQDRVIFPPTVPLPKL